MDHHCVSGDVWLCKAANKQQQQHNSKELNEHAVLVGIL